MNNKFKRCKTIVVFMMLFIIFNILFNSDRQIYEYKDLDLNRYSACGIRVAIIDSGLISDELVSTVYILKKGLHSGKLVHENHGTKVTNIILGTSTLDVPLQSDIISYNIIEEDGKSSVDLLCDAIAASIADNVDIINISLSTQSKSKRLEDLIAQALRNNMIIVASYDNVKSNPSYPASYNGVIGVKQATIKQAVVRKDKILLPENRQFRTMAKHKEEIVCGNSFATAFITGSIIRIMGCQKKFGKKIVSREELIDELSRRI